jgi:hypothetical protein
MKRTLYRLFLSCVAGVGIACAAILLLARGFANDKAPPKPPPVIVQNAPREPIPNENVNAVPRAPQNPSDSPYISKTSIESPTKKLLANQTVPSSSTPGSAFVNPKVEPGKVHWHKTFADACSAAKKSGKPVLLFQMMGKLDERFC